MLLVPELLCINEVYVYLPVLLDKFAVCILNVANNEEQISSYEGVKIKPSTDEKMENQSSNLLVLLLSSFLSYR